ncbi:N-acetyltransferase family protein [Flavobacterium sp. SM15]|uniref:GNAT family N-acetyltransferase n=1 Tax=Flavobacterium sp. SM15 TaxID=2908005 RepID=UPI001EDA9764|nr:GNAT family N-acetyltransferase [Flavobacterium sp. SM15]MCG2612480.1 N-acetyltransferase family protein [Flavobacterium sp. SM15]
MSITIRQATKNDLPAVLEIVNYEILHSTAIWDYDTRTLEEQTAIFKEKSDKGFPFLVAEKNGIVVGFGTYGPFRFKIGYRFTVEHSVYVHKDFTGNGIGSLLLKELIEMAKLQKLHTMIGVIDSENTGSISFHERMGFKRVGHIKETGFKFNRWLDSIFVQILL